MACKVNWTPKALLTFNDNITSLEENWTKKEIIKFISLVEEKIMNIAQHPKIGSSRNLKNPNIRFTLIHKRVALIYRHRPRKNEIEQLVFWNTYQKPNTTN